MSKSSAHSAIRLRGVRQNNLKNFDLDLPLNQLIVVTGLSGSGKSSLAFDTLFAEGQRRYIETFSPYARQFLDRMDKPKVDSIEGIPPAIAIEQRNSVRTTRSTVGTMTEICDYMKLLWPHVAQLHCRQCGKPVRKDTPQQIWEKRGAWGVASDAKTQAAASPDPLDIPSAAACEEVLITFELPLSEKLGLDESLGLVAKQGYQRILVGEEVVRIEEASKRLKSERGGTNSEPRLNTLTVVQDRVKLNSGARARFVEACEQAYHFGKGKLTVRPVVAGLKTGGALRRFSNRLHCAECDIEYKDPSPALFSFNHPVGACPSCRGFGRIISIDYSLAIPDKTKTLAQGVVKPWQGGQSAECQRDLIRMCRHFEVPTDVPFEQLPEKWQEFVIEGEPGYGKDEEHEWPRAWYGLKGYFRWLESKSYKMHVRVLLSRYRAYTTCPACNGMRFQPDSLLYRVASPSESAATPDLGDKGFPTTLSLAGFYQLPIRRAFVFLEQLGVRYHAKKNDPLRLALAEVQARLGYLNQVGLGYLTLDRPTRSLSGGETERVSLTTCLGTRLVNTLFVLDEPSVGLHSRDTERLIGVLEQLRDAGNTVLVVEHEASVMRAADQIIDIGPGHGAAGGQVVFQGTVSEIGACSQSLTGQYLTGTKTIPPPQRRPVIRPGNETLEMTRPPASLRGGKGKFTGTSSETIANPREASEATNALNEAVLPYRPSSVESPGLRLTGVTVHNLENFSVEIPLERFVCITGVSGSGKTTLVRDVLLPLLTRKLSPSVARAKASDRLDSDLSEAGDEGDDSESSGSVRGRLELPEQIERVVLVDQSILGKTPRSNPAVYIGAFEDIREVYAQSEEAKRRGLNASAFSFNSGQGQCERCRGAGFEKIEMQFLSDIYIRCPECDGRRYRSHILDIKLAGPSKTQEPLSIADLLDSTVDEAVAFLEGLSDCRPATRAAAQLKLLQETGLGYLKLGQPINTLSGGESQRLKLVKHLAETLAPEVAVRSGVAESNGRSQILFLFDEPTTGLHFDDVRVLLKVFQRLVDAGHSLIVIEHNLEVIKSCDWVVDLGPEAGDLGGQLVAEGTPEQVAQCKRSHTGQALRGVLSPKNEGRRRPRTQSLEVSQRQSTFVERKNRV